MQRTKAASLVVLAALAVTSTSVRALADEKEACVAASDQAQTLRDDGKYRAARAQLLVCSRDVCPAIVRRDCEKWLAPIDPGEHTFRYEAPGAAPVEQHAVIRVGEKNRMLTAIVMPLAVSAATPAA